MTRGLTIGIPTYGRDRVLVETIEALAALMSPCDELVVVDQTPAHDEVSDNRLQDMSDRGLIRWIRSTEPSITRAMNRVLREARKDIVLFLDDDLLPDRGLLEAHRAAHERRYGAIAAGRVLQPWHHGQPDPEDSRFGFNSLSSRPLREFMGGNFSVPRADALTLGGFDENFVQVAYRFEADFALRWVRSGRSIWYLPEALIHHLKAPAGGTRVHGDFLRTARPGHSVGEYYFLMKSRPSNWLSSMLRRPVRAVATRHHLRRPWWIPVTMIAETSGFFWALLLALKGRKLVIATTPE